MLTRRFLWAFLPLYLLACNGENATVQPPVPLTPDEQVVANCQALRDALEQYAAEHDSDYPALPAFWRNLGIDLFNNPYTGETHEPSGTRARFPGQMGLELYPSCDGEQVLGYRISGYGVDHQLIVLESLAGVPADVRYVHDVVVANAFLVADAARRWADSNGGEFPTDLGSDAGSDGKTLVDLLPNGRLLVNPVYGREIEPVDGSAMGSGSVGYVPWASSEGFTRSFMIEGIGCDLYIIVAITPFSETEDITNNESHDLRAAIEAFKQASGEYPHNLDTETTPGGETVFDLYFGNGHHQYSDFVNPYTQDHYFPFVGTASNKGEIAYQPIEVAGVVSDYVITGRGLFREVAHLGPWPAP